MKSPHLTIIGAVVKAAAPDGGAAGAARQTDVRYASLINEGDESTHLAPLCTKHTFPFACIISALYPCQRVQQNIGSFKLRLNFMYIC